MIPTTKLKTAVIQLRSTGDTAANLQRADSLIERAAADGARLIVLPENFGFMDREGRRIGSGEDPGHGPVSRFSRDAAQRHGVFLAAGSVPLTTREPDRVTNSLLVWSPDGSLVARYDKMHLFDIALEGDRAYRESRHVDPGVDVVTVDIDGWTVGLSICYDLRFPELYRALVDRGAHLLLVPAAFTARTGAAHWELLVRARAIENQCWLAAAAQWGEHAPERASWGRSMIVDPWGDVVARLDEGEGQIAFDIDPVRLAAVRSAIPCLEHRRL